MTPRRVVAAFHVSEPTGPSRAIQPALERLARDAEVTIALPGPGRTAQEVSGFARVAYLGHGPFVFPRGVRDAAVVAPRARLEVRRFRALLRRERAELAFVSTTTLPALVLAARLEGVPAIVYAHEIWRQNKRGDAIRRQLGRATVALEARLASATMACSRMVAAELPLGAATVVMYPPIDPAPAPGDPAALARRHGVPATRPCLAALGNLSRGRGQDDAVRALADLRRDHPGARLVIAGLPHPRAIDRAFAEELVALARRLGVADAVHFCGLEVPADVFAACDVVVNPARFPETFGMVAMEALAAGRPVVSTTAGAVREVLADGRHALLVAPDQPHALADAVRRVLADPALAERLVEAGREHVRASFAPDRVLPRFDEAVALALSRRRRAQGR